MGGGASKSKRASVRETSKTKGRKSAAEPSSPRKTKSNSGLAESSSAPRMAPREPQTHPALGLGEVGELLPAYITTDYTPSPRQQANGAIAVKRGMLVDVLLSADPPPPAGWWACRVQPEGQRSSAAPSSCRGLVPQSHITAAAPDGHTTAPSRLSQRLNEESSSRRGESRRSDSHRSARRESSSGYTGAAPVGGGDEDESDPSRPATPNPLELMFVSHVGGAAAGGGGVGGIGGGVGDRTSGGDSGGGGYGGGLASQSLPKIGRSVTTPEAKLCTPKPRKEATMSGRLGWDQAERTVAVRRTDQGFGIDVNERNIIVRISPGSAAEEDGQLKVGERIVAIDTVELGEEGGVTEVLARLPRKQVHHFLVAPRWKRNAGDEGGESAERGSKATSGGTTERSNATTVCSHTGYASSSVGDEDEAPPGGARKSSAPKLDLSRLRDEESKQSAKATAASAKMFASIDKEGREAPSRPESDDDDDGLATTPRPAAAHRKPPPLPASPAPAPAAAKPAEPKPQFEIALAGGGLRELNQGRPGGGKPLSLAPRPPPPPQPPGSPSKATSSRVVSRSSSSRASAGESSSPRKGFRDVKLARHLGTGAHGSVYVGEKGGEEFAVKVLQLEGADAQDIKNEIRILRGCDCEHIVAYKDAFMREYQMKQTLWVVMEFCEAGSTLDVMRKVGRGFDEPCVAAICRGVLRALEYMHVERKVIHRDIKAANVLLASDGTVKLADLGIVAQLQHTMSKRGTMIGTPHWMAPESLAVQPGAAGYDNKVDVWGLGITAIELFEMSPPFKKSASIYECMMRVVNGPPATLKDPAVASGAMHDFISAALVKDPSERPSAAQLLEHDCILTAADQGQAKLAVLVDRFLDGHYDKPDPMTSL